MWFIQEENKKKRETQKECVRTEIALCSVFVHEMSRRGRDRTKTAHPEPQAILKKKKTFWETGLLAFLGALMTGCLDSL